MSSLPSIKQAKPPTGTPRGRPTRSDSTAPPKASPGKGVNSGLNGSRTGSRAGTAARSGKGTVAPTVAFERQCKGVYADEDQRRGAIELQETIAFQEMANEIDEVFEGPKTARQTKVAMQVDALSTASTKQGEQVTSIKAIAESMASRTTEMQAMLNEYVTHAMGKDRERLLFLEAENQVLLRDLNAAKEQIEALNSECTSLRGSLARRLLRTSAEYELQRQIVRDEIAKNAVDIVALREALNETIEKTVMNFHKPTYEGSLKELQDLALQSHQRVQEQAATLHGMVSAIGAEDAVDDVKTMHSNLPPQYRKKLQLLSKEQLLNLVDVLSFEDGVVECTGRALHAINSGATQTVF